jgi:hypothetical protein
MAMTIQLAQLVEVARSNGTGALGDGVSATLNGATLRLTFNGLPVFKINVDVQGTNLTLDRAETPLGERGRGWGRLGLLLALRWGAAQGCTTADLGTQVEMGAWMFWGGLQYGTKRSLQSAIIAEMRWINTHIAQPYPNGTSVMIIRDRPGGARAIARRGSFNG